MFLPRALLLVLPIFLGGAAVAQTPPNPKAARLPNIVLMFADDLGYADIGAFGAQGYQTPHLDQLARDGIQFTHFYVAQPVCSASRAALLTGCYSNRVGINGALGPNARVGLNDQETTIAELLKTKGYATGIVGKWHLGHHPQFLPTRHGFDMYFGLPYSNDMWPHHPEAIRGTYPNLPLIENETVIDPDVTAEDQRTLTTRYAQRAVQFIDEHHTRPFFLYVAHSMPHVPLHVSGKFAGKTARGLFGDVVEEIDWSMGQILQALSRHGLERDTLVIFTSDNGPWLSYGNHAGSAGPLREGKGTTWEGGVREPFLARWTGTIPAGSVCTQPAMTIDLLPTFAALTHASLPTLPIDGKDISDLLLAKPGATSPQAAYYFYYNVGELQAVRSGEWKLTLPHNSRSMKGQTPGKDGRPGKYVTEKVGLELYNLERDPGETTNVFDQHPEIVEKLQRLAEQAREQLGDSATKREGKGARTPGRVVGLRLPTAILKRSD